MLIDLSRQLVPARADPTCLSLPWEVSWVIMAEDVARPCLVRLTVEWILLPLLGWGLWPRDQTWPKWWADRVPWIFSTLCPRIRSPVSRIQPQRTPRIPRYCHRRPSNEVRCTSLEVIWPSSCVFLLISILYSIDCSNGVNVMIRNPRGVNMCNDVCDVF